MGEVIQTCPHEELPRCFRHWPSLEGKGMFDSFLSSCFSFLLEDHKTLWSVLTMITDSGLKWWLSVCVFNKSTHTSWTYEFTRTVLITSLDLGCNIQNIASFSRAKHNWIKLKNEFAFFDLWRVFSLLILSSQYIEIIYETEFWTFCCILSHFLLPSSFFH